MLTCSCIYLLNLRDSVLEDKNRVAVKDVVNVQGADKRCFHACDVARAAVNRVVLLRQNDERFLPV